MERDVEKMMKIIKEMIEEKGLTSPEEIERFVKSELINNNNFDDIDETEKLVGQQLINSSSKIFLMGMGHVKSGLIHRLKNYTDAVFLDVGSSIDAIARIIDINRAYFGDCTNYQIDGPPLYEAVDYLAYEGKGNHVLLERE